MASQSNNNIQTFRQKCFDDLITNSKFADVGFICKNVDCKDNDNTDTQVVYFVRGLIAAHSVELQSVLYDESRISKLDDPLEPLSLDVDESHNVEMILDMTHIDTIAFKWFLKFVYGLQSNINSKNVVPLLHFAKYYNIKQIKQACLDVIQNAQYKVLPTKSIDINHNHTEYNCENDDVFYFVVILELLIDYGLNDEIASILDNIIENNNNSIYDNNSEILIQVLSCDFYLKLDQLTIEEWFFKILKIHETICNETLFLAIAHWCKFNPMATIKDLSNVTSRKQMISQWCERLINCPLIKYIKYENMNILFYQSFVEKMINSNPNLLTIKQKNKIISYHEKQKKNLMNNDNDAKYLAIETLQTSNFVVTSVSPTFVQGCCNNYNYNYGIRIRNDGAMNWELETIYKEYFFCSRINERIDELLDYKGLKIVEMNEVFDLICDEIVNAGIIPKILSWLTLKFDSDSQLYMSLQKLLQLEALLLIGNLGM